jgi:hypothetical protein
MPNELQIVKRRMVSRACSSGCACVKITGKVCGFDQRRQAAFLAVSRAIAAELDAIALTRIAHLGEGEVTPIICYYGGH